MQQPSGIYEELRKEKEQSAKLLATCDMLNREIESYKQKIAALEAMSADKDRKFSEITSLYEKEKERLAKLYAITDDVNKELIVIKQELDSRDKLLLTIKEHLKGIEKCIEEFEQSVKK